MEQWPGLEDLEYKFDILPWVFHTNPNRSYIPYDQVYSLLISLFVLGNILTRVSAHDVSLTRKYCLT